MATDRETDRSHVPNDKQKQFLADFPDAREPFRQLEQKRAWWRRYWKRVALLSLAGTIAVAGLIVWAVLASTVGGIKASPPFQEAMRRATADPQVIASLGEPIRSGWMIGGSTMSNGSVSASELRIPLSGPKGRAVLHVAGTRPPGQPWQYQQLTAELPSGRKVDLLKQTRAE